ncbi:hypothetical protein Sjap_015029 [Stephania japonica]|uniref:CRM domain-containing protein n=1 Tax=Stephania japonica TaxID=461633 RepID=A0AAP0IIM9_9MAGN
MAFSLSTAKSAQIPLHHTSIALRSSHTHSSSSALNRVFTAANFSTISSLLKPYCYSSSIRTTHRTKRPHNNNNNNNNSNNNNNQRRGGGANTWHKSRVPSSAPWLKKWTPVERDGDYDDDGGEEKRERNVVGGEGRVESRYFDGDKGRGAIERIVFRGIGVGRIRLCWTRMMEGIKWFCHGRGRRLGVGRGWGRERGRGWSKRRVKAPTLAELTLEDSELRRLRTMGMTLRERINIPKAGVTQVILEKIHDKWRKAELVRLKFHETLAHDMKKAHEIVEHRTNGLVIWKSGSVMVVYRGNNYVRPQLRTQSVDMAVDAPFIPDVSSDHLGDEHGKISDSIPEKSQPTINNSYPMENMTGEEAEYDSLLDGLGPRFVDWWGIGLLPVDADLLPPTVPGYKTPFRLLPTRMRLRLTNAEMTNLRKLSKALPCHFALGRNRNHQGLASAIVKLWEKSLVAKIAVKRGIQNTNNKLMADELKKLTGGTLLLRNKYYIIIYRGKDFLPTSVSAALAERQELTKQVQDVEEKVRNGIVGIAAKDEFETEAAAGTLAEFHEAQARWGREISNEERQNMQEEASRAKTARMVRKIEKKFAAAQAKKLRAERLLAKIEVSMVPVGPSDDQETITDEERFMFRRVGLRMKAYLPLGIRGVFDGVIENMHLHWKHRELVKLISKQKTLSFVEDTARLLEYESGGILVAIERVPRVMLLFIIVERTINDPLALDLEIF